MPGLEIILTPGFKEITGKPSTVEDIAATLAPVDRLALIRHSIRVLNSLAADRQTGFTSTQDAFIAALPPDLSKRYREYAASSRAPLRFLHPAQQLVLVHAAARFGAGAGGVGLGDPNARAAWATACLCINDHLMKEPVPRGDLPSWEKALYLFSEDAARWELVNPSRPDKSLGRTRALFTDVAGLTPAFQAASTRLRAAFQEQLGVDFETAYNLTAFLIYHWMGESKKVGQNPDAPLINRQTWLQNSSIPLEMFDRYLAKVALHLEDIVPAFDASTGGMSFRDVLPFRRSPLFRIDENGVAFLAPQFMSEKGGIDLLWLLTNPPGGAKEKWLFTEDFSLLYEGYVRHIFEQLGPRLGGVYVADVSYSSDDGEGQIDGLIKAGSLLGVVEVKASLVRAPLLAAGSVQEIRADLERKFIGSAGTRKGVSQLAHAIHWLGRERRAGRTVRDLDLKGVDTIVPILLVADRHLRYPGIGQWFDYHFQQMLRPVWPHVGPLVLCGTEDLEAIEHRALTGQIRFMDVFDTYTRRARRAKEPLWMYYDAPGGAHPRLDRILDNWFQELLNQRIMLR